MACERSEYMESCKECGIPIEETPIPIEESAGADDGPISIEGKLFCSVLCVDLDTGIAYERNP